MVSSDGVRGFAVRKYTEGQCPLSLGIVTGTDPHQGIQIVYPLILTSVPKVRYTHPIPKLCKEFNIIYLYRLVAQEQLLEYPLNVFGAGDRRMYMRGSCFSHAI